MLKVQISQQAPFQMDMEFECLQGELLALVGPSGSGKTSALRAIAGLIPIKEGTIKVDSEVWLDSAHDLSLPAHLRSVGMVFQNFALFPHLTALENIGLALPKGALTKDAHELLLDMQLEDLQDRYPHQLSGGQCQRVALARAFARKPKVLLLDEAFSAVDYPTRMSLYEELIKLRQRISIPIVMVTHDLREARLLSNRICILDQGKTLQQATPDHIFSSPRNARVAALVGLRDIYSGTFFKLPEHGGSPHAQMAKIVCGHASDSIELMIHDKGRLPNQTEVKWVIAGQYVALSNVASNEPNTLCGSIERILQLSEISSVKVRLPSPLHQMHLELSTRHIQELHLEVGNTVYLKLDPDGIHIMPVYSDLKHKYAQKQKKEQAQVIGAVILAAGQGLRLGGVPKGLIEIDGLALIVRQIQELKASGVAEIFVVTGYYQEQFSKILEKYHVHLIHNGCPERGQASSVRLGLEYVAKHSSHIEALLMVLSDQPLLELADIRQLIEQFKTREYGHFLIPIVNGHRGNPVMLSKIGLGLILAKNNDSVVRTYMDEHPDEVVQWETNNLHFTFDLDTLESVQEFTQISGLVVKVPNSG